MPLNVSEEAHMFARKTSAVLILVLTLLLPSQAGTRIYESLEDVLRRHPGLTVVEARVVSSQFSQRESSDDIVWKVDRIKVHRLGKLQAEPSSQLRFSAYRPAVTSRLKNRSPYSTGSSLEFATQTGKTYLFLCPSPDYVLRVENRDRLNEVIGLLDRRSKWFYNWR